MGLCSQMRRRRTHGIHDGFASLGSQHPTRPALFWPALSPPPLLLARGLVPSQARWESCSLGPMFLHGRGMLLVRWSVWEGGPGEDSLGSPMGLGAVALTDLRRCPQGRGGVSLCPLDRSGLEGRGTDPSIRVGDLSSCTKLGVGDIAEQPLAGPKRAPPPSHPCSRTSPGTRA